MAWSRDEANLGISGATAYSYTECDWEVQADKCVYRHIGGVTSPYNFNASATATGEWWDGTWHGYSPAVTGTGTFTGYGDLPLFDITDSFARTASDRTVSVGTTTSMMGGSARSYIDYTVPHLAPSVTWASSNPVVRNSDNSITLTWNAPALEYSAMCLEVSTDGGSWSQFAVLWNTATSYEWTGCSADHSYQFRIRTNYLASYSAYDVCATIIYMTPAAPVSISTAAAGGTNIDVSVVNPSPVATVLQYAVSTDGGSTWGAEQDSASLTSFSVSASGSGIKIRVRNKNATGTSDWLESGTITTICPPAKPTITSPQNGVWDVSQPLNVAWLHNTLDGSAQTAAKVELIKTNVTPPVAHIETYDPLTANSVSISFATAQSWIAGLAAGDTITVAVKTKGADASYSSFNSVAGVKLAQAPTVNITSPASTVTGMPIELEATYSDMTGYTCQAATVSLQKDGRTLFSEPATIAQDPDSPNIATITASLDTSEFLPANGESYTVVLTARSSSSLQATANATFTTAFTEPQAGGLSITNDPETGYASLLATFDNHASDTEYSGATNEQFDTTEGYVRSLTVEGKSKKWNQLAPTNASYNTQGGKPMTSGASFNAGDKLYLSVRSTRTSGSNPMSFTLYAYDGSAKNQISVTLAAASETQEKIATATVSATSLGTTSATNGNCWLYPYFQGNTATVDQIMLVDLTDIFGAGNEPATVDAFKATDVYKAKLAAGELYDYDAGSLVSIGSVGVRGRNLCDPATFDNATAYYEINADGSITVKASDGRAWSNVPAVIFLKAGSYNISRSDARGFIAIRTSANDYASDFLLLGNTASSSGFTLAQDCYLKIKLGYGTGATYPYTTTIQITQGSSVLPYEPYSLTTIPALLRSVGTVHDQLQVAKTDVKVARKVGVVDLGTLEWYYSSTNQRFNTVSPLDNCSTVGSWNGVKSLNAIYTQTDVPTTPDGRDDIYGISSGYLYVRDTSYTSAASFKTAMSGVYLFYELATPTTDTLPDISLIQLGTAAIVTTDLDSTFSMVAWDGSADAVSISVARVNADGITPLIEDAASGAGAVDKYAPLNTPYQYAVTTKSSANAVKTVYVDNEIVTDLWFAYWGDNLASAKWNPDNGGIQLTRPQKTRVYYAGRKDPVSYDGAAVSLTETPSWMLVDRSEVEPFVKLIEDGGRGVYKSCDGWVYHADFDLSLTPKYTAIGYYGGIGLTVTRIAGEQL